MKRYYRLALAALAALLVLAGCTWEQVKLQMQFQMQEGEVYHVKMTIDQDITQMLDEEEMNLQQVMGFGFSMTATEVDEAGNTWVDVVYEWLKMSQQSPMGEMDYDSDEPADENDLSARSFQALIGKGFALQFSPEGEILAVEGLDAMMDEIIDDLEIDDPELVAQMKQSLREQYNADSLKDQIGDIVIDYPEGPVRIGDTWTATAKAEGQLPLTVDSTYTLLAFEDGVATVAISSTLATDPDAEPVDMSLYQMEYRLTGHQEAISDIDIATGLSLSSTITQTVGGEMVLTMEDDEMVVPMTLESLIQLDMTKGP